jgi:hypothetical protein
MLSKEPISGYVQLKRETAPEFKLVKKEKKKKKNRGTKR